MPVNFIVFDDMGINHLPMNSGVGSLNSLWLPLHKQALFRSIKMHSGMIKEMIFLFLVE